MQHFPSTLSRTQSDASAARIRAHFDEHGFGLWGVEVPGLTEHAGFVGLSHPSFEAHFTPCVEIGWRLARRFWCQGFASEGAHAVADFAFRELGLNEIASFTAATSLRSQRVTQRIGMQHDPSDDFADPALEPDAPLRDHVLYRLSQRLWQRHVRARATRASDA
ncbi:GNAT family N-acetyltransferase [Myxococcota bacterium]|nr:GNAT family N-acetyltransferase [Myxococcota bacterium]